MGAACLAQLGRLLPPFKPLGPEIIAALLPLTRSEAADKPIPLNQAIVVQIWLIFFGSEACTELADAGPAQASTEHSVPWLLVRLCRCRRPLSWIGCAWTLSASSASSAPAAGGQD